MSEPYGNDPGVVTLQKIANAAGVSRATVSRGLKNHPRIGSSTALRIQRLANEMGYQRDAHLSDLMIHLRKRKRVVDRPSMALIFWQDFPIETEALEQKDTTMGGIWHRAKECGYQPEIFNLAQFSNKKHLARILYSRGIHAGILCPAQTPSPLPDLPWEHFSVVAVGHSILSPNLHRCANDHFERMQMCIRNLQKIGYQRIGAVLTQAIDRRTHGFYHASYLLEQAGKSGDIAAPLLYAGGVQADDEKALSRWFDKWKPEAIICTGTVDFIHQWLKKRGVKIPKDVGIADLHHPSEAGYSGVRENAFEVGVAAVDLLITLMQANETGLPEIPRNIFVGGTWVDGTSTRRLRR